MALSAGMRLGPYEIVAPLGAGGMGEVYKARDTRLDRTVAIKVVPPEFAGDSQFRERFDREARAVAALNHPHICTLYDVGHHDASPSAQAIDFLVMEHLEGETLESRLKTGPLPIAQTLEYAIQIADALDKAHRSGIVHRDLKPGNVMLTKTGAKLLDFGLAKAIAPVSGAASVSMLPTTPPELTAQGIILGTFQYMAPEQLEGLDADTRTDIFAFGAVLYEMLTGNKAFGGKSQASLIASIMHVDPAPPSTLQPLTPRALDRVVGKCLAKDAAERWQTAKDLCDELKWVTNDPPTHGAIATSHGSRWRRVALAAGILLLGVALTSMVVWAYGRWTPSSVPESVRFTIVPPSSERLFLLAPDRHIAISPNGTQIVYRTVSVERRADPAAGRGRLVVRSLDRLDVRPLEGETGVWTFFSPDSRWIGFFSGITGELQKMPIAGGTPVTLCRYSGTPRGASWGSDGMIVFATSDTNTGLLSVSENGGDPKVLTRPDRAHGEGDHLFPFILPGRRAVLFTVTAIGQLPSSAQSVVLELDTGKRKNLVAGTQAEYAETGHLIYATVGGLRAVRFDLDRLEVRGDPISLVEQVATFASGAADFSLSRNGILVYVSGAARTDISPEFLRRLAWVNRTGHEEILNAPARTYMAPRLSPDGTRIAVHFSDAARGTAIGIWDLGRQKLTPLTFGAQDQFPLWTRDSRQIIFSSSRAGNEMNLYRQAADGTGTAERLTTSTNRQFAPFSISPDGSRVAFAEINSETGNDLQLLVLTGQRHVEPLIQTPFGEINGEISPDGRWITYQSDESGQNQIYVRPFPRVDDGKWQISTNGGVKPAWARNLRELFYIDRDGVLMTVPIQATEKVFVAGNPAKLFELRGRYFIANNARTYDVGPDGQRFLMLKEAPTEQPSDSTPASIVVVLNWLEELKQRVPTK